MSALIKEIHATWKVTNCEFDLYLARQELDGMF